MTDTFIELSEDEFDRRFPLLSNHLNTSASWAFGDDGGCLFETYGEELAFVKQQDSGCIWTLVDGDLYVISGFHFVNRIGYLISREALPDNVTIQVHIPTESDDVPESEEA